MKEARKLGLVALVALSLTGCQNGGVPALGISGCELSGIGLGAAGGALLGGLIGHSWTAAAIGGGAGAATGFLVTKAFAESLGCEDKKKLVQTTQQAAVERPNHRVPFTAAQPQNGKTVTGYVMPVGNWHTDPDGRKVRTVKQVLTDGTETQTSTVEVASTDIDTSGGGYVLPR
jgi:hypothetical protein